MKYFYPSLNKNLWQLIGPSIVFVALSLSSGEIMLWPDMIGKYGLQIIWLIPFVLILQVGVNLEIERYTITTGKNILTGLIQKQGFLKYLFILGVFGSLLWPGWVSVAGSTLSVLLKANSYGNVLSAFLMMLVLTIWFHPKSYQIMEQISKIGLFLIVITSSIVLINNFKLSLILSSFQNVWIPNQSNDKLTYLAALAFGGTSGVLNLVYSHWVTAKKYGATQIPAGNEIDWNNPKSLINWQSWWKILVKEHLFIFYLGNLLGTIVVGLVAVMTLGASKTPLSGFEIIRFQINYLNNEGWNLGNFWGIGVVILFVMAQMTILDAAGRLLSQAFKVKKNDSLVLKWWHNHNNLSHLVGFIGLLVLIAGIFNSKISQPAQLIQISATLSAFLMVIYPIFILQINSNELPIQTRPKLWNKILVITCSLFYAVASIWTFFVK